MDGMQNQKRPFTQYDDNISPTQEDNGSNGAGDAPIQDNGTKNANFSCGGMPTCTKVDYPLPKDPHASEPGGNEDHLQNYGLASGMATGDHGGIHGYGLAGGEVKQDGADDSVAGQGFGKGND